MGHRSRNTKGLEFSACVENVGFDRTNVRRPTELHHLKFIALAEASLTPGLKLVRDFDGGITTEVVNKRESVKVHQETARNALTAISAFDLERTNA
jgi:hypothetical protein